MLLVNIKGDVVGRFKKSSYSNCVKYAILQHRPVWSNSSKVVRLVLMPSLSSIQHILKPMLLIMLMVAGRVQHGCWKVTNRLHFGRGKVISQRRRTVIWCLQNYVVATSLRNVIVTKT